MQGFQAPQQRIQEPPDGNRAQGKLALRGNQVTEVRVHQLLHNEQLVVVVDGAVVVATVARVASLRVENVLGANSSSSMVMLMWLQQIQDADDLIKLFLEPGWYIGVPTKVPQQLQLAQSSPRNQQRV